MSRFDALQLYLMTLSVIQPARIQDIEKGAESLFGKEAIDAIGLDAVRFAHEIALKSGFVIVVRRGSYCVSRSGASIIRHGKISSQIDNRRLFLMKKQRRAFN